MCVTRYIRVWITQGHEHQAAGIVRTFQNLLPQPSVPELDEMLPMSREGEGQFLPGSGATSYNWWGSWVLVALGTSTGRAASRVSESLSSVVSLELVLQAREKYLVPPFLLQVQWWHIGSLELATVGMFIPQRSRNTISHAFFYFSESLYFKYTPLHGLLKSLLCPVSVSLLQLWSWGWRMEPIAVRAEWKWSTKENGAQWIVTGGDWRMHL